MKWDEIKPNLKTCAHCKGEARYVFSTFHGRVFVYVTCNRCGVMTRPRALGIDYEAALCSAREWNRRRK